MVTSSIADSNLGQIGERSIKSKSDRLSVYSELFSGYKEGHSRGCWSVTPADSSDQDTTTSVEHTVKWLYEGKDVDKDNKDLQTSQTGCYTTVSFLTSHHIYTSRFEPYLHVK
ncbi:hypothetical protein L3Q82_011342 [Scortum barcoo]|uniref:Uncharacterized protein n=1 Tax=Scortum barcoo TaxID=214431 RepID=A0ACB8W9P8_9TELE|nr:hypothetical protein L3Q82_011342 [Scortum barcoo]